MMWAIAGISIAGVIIAIWAYSPMKWPFTDERVERWKQERAADVADHEQRVAAFKESPPEETQPSRRGGYWSS